MRRLHGARWQGPSAGALSLGGWGASPSWLWTCANPEALNLSPQGCCWQLPHEVMTAISSAHSPWPPGNRLTQSCHWDHRLSCRPGKSRDLKSPMSGARSEMKNSQEWILLRILHCEYFHGRLALHYESGGHVFHPLSHAGKLRDGRNGAVHVSLSQVLMRLPVWLLQGVSTWGGRGMDQPTGLGVSVPV